ncbi:hypothetical protein E4K64_00860 [Bradyrhizobium frederickii]|uniref:Uncharacterized protein n=1 Tax=Bradyrhizobium frederickii TaxID=2560054 RepID=A0A4Y9PPM8_9BRAD|nr:hypothetical protein [Bradyrhizobium frederickii]TFV80403.1 hypothetical protein E4K64_00860 [Bradyrhizobium frederickii]
MPLARYFLVVGAALYALLLISSAYLAKSQGARNAENETSIIRIHSDRQWPERIVFDTPAPTIIPPQVARTEPTVAAPIDIVPAKAPEREAMAQLRSSDTFELQSTTPRHRELQPERHKLAKRHAMPRTFRVARQSRFDWFGRGVW